MKKHTVPYYTRKNDKVYLVIPSVKINDYRHKHELTIYIEEKQVYSGELWTKNNNMSVKREFELNELLKNQYSIKVRVLMSEDDEIFFDSDASYDPAKFGMVSLHREFIIFNDKKEIFTCNNKPTNYFIYSLNFDAFIVVPKEVTLIGKHLYNIYPKDGENLIGEKASVFFRSYGFEN